VTALLEREKETEQFRVALAEVNSGSGGAISISAGAGMGKTRLLREFRRSASETGLNVLSARATELEQDFPFAMVRQLFEPQLANLTPEERLEILEGASAVHGALGLDASSGDTDDPFAVLHGLYWVTAALAERGPLLLAIDDAHWADSSSLDYLGFLLPRLEELPVLLVVTVRPDEPDSPLSLTRILTDPIVRHLTLAPLSREAAGALLAQMWERKPEATFTATCHEVSGGNPFLLSELAHTLLAQGIEPTADRAELVREQAPGRVARTVLARIARLPSEAMVAARSLAVLGDGSDLSLLAAMDGIDPEVTQGAADELRASAIFDGGSPLRFVHPLVRNAIYSDMSVGERSRAHARAAVLLRERRVSPERIATQLLATEAQGERTTAETLLEAGEQALGAGAPRSAIAYLYRALREPPPPELRAAVLDPLLTASYRAADQAAFAAVEDDVLAEWTLDPSVRSRWAIQLTMLMALGGRFEEAAALLREAIQVAVAEDDLERAYQMQAQLSTLAAIAPSVPEVTIDARPGRIEPGTPTARLAAAMEVRSAVANGTGQEIADAAKRALEDDGVIFAEEPELAAAAIAVMSLVTVDEVDAARYAAERALAIAREHGATPELARAQFLKGFVAWGAGDLVSAEADLHQAIDLARLAGIFPLVLMYTAPLMEVLIERDELEAAEAALQATGMADAPISFDFLAGMLGAIRGHLRYEKGEFERAMEDFEPLLSEEVKTKMGFGPSGSVAPFAARALIALGKSDRAREMADENMAKAREWGVSSGMAHVSRAVAATREPEEAVELLEAAVALMEGSPRRLEHAHALAELGVALRRSGRRADARVPLRKAFGLARRCGAGRIAKRANAELEATGATVRRYVPIGVESLTPSERRVADLAASGMTNRQIAQSLFVTVKTVEAHLSAAYGKLDISSRRRLSKALAGENLPPP
jgi:DNA-binding CsgD family transcriptional regulator/tetratricopeptide (TPR) repeat protein